MRVFNLSAVHQECGCEFIERDVYTSEEGYHTQSEVNQCEMHLLVMDAYFGRDIAMTEQQRYDFVESLSDLEYSEFQVMGVAAEEYLKVLCQQDLKHVEAGFERNDCNY